MHKFLPILALCGATVAAAVPAEPLHKSVFSYSQWVEDIIANPNGDNFTPEQAVAAASNSTDIGSMCSASGFHFPPLTSHVYRWCCHARPCQEMAVQQRLGRSMLGM